MTAVPMSLVRTAAERDPTLLLTSWEAWAEDSATAPQWRLDRLTFAVDSCRRVLIRGTPLPSLPGARLVEREGLATPAGWTWQPPVHPAVLRQTLGLQPGDLALLRESPWQIVRAANWVRATRSAVRATAAEATEAQHER